MKIKVTYTNFNTTVQRNVAKVYKVIPFGIPSGITADVFTQKGGLIAGTAASTYSELAPGSAGQYLTPDSSQAAGLKWETPSVAVADPTNRLINGGFDFAQRQTPGTLTAISDNAYSADRWRITRENADLQYQRNDATGETGLTSRYYGRFKKVTNAGKFFVCQIIEGINSVPLRGKTLIFQMKMKASSSKTIRMAIIELQNTGTMDTIPASIVSSWNVDSTDPTLGSNLAVITGAESKSVTTSWQNFSVSVTVPSNSKNILCAVWSDADFSANDILDVAEGGLFLGSSLLAWAPRFISHELILCQRYYEKSYPVDTAPGTADVNILGHAFVSRASNTLDRESSYYKVTKRIVPTTSQVYSPSSGTAANIYNLSNATDLSAGILPYTNMCIIYPAASTTADHIYAANWIVECEL